MRALARSIRRHCIALHVAEALQQHDFVAAQGSLRGRYSGQQAHARHHTARALVQSAE